MSQSVDAATGSQPVRRSACSHSAELEAGFAGQKKCDRFQNENAVTWGDLGAGSGVMRHE